MEDLIQEIERTYDELRRGETFTFDIREEIDRELNRLVEEAKKLQEERKQNIKQK